MAKITAFKGLGVSVPVLRKGSETAAQYQARTGTLSPVGRAPSTMSPTLILFGALGLVAVAAVAIVLTRRKKSGDSAIPNMDQVAAMFGRARSFKEMKSHRKWAKRSKKAKKRAKKGFKKAWKRFLEKGSWRKPYRRGRSRGRRASWWRRRGYSGSRRRSRRRRCW